MCIPVFFIHSGNQKYLEIAINSAEKYNKDVYLLGDENNKIFSKKHINIASLDNSKYEEFKSVYKHMSTNDYKFEINCFKRYFLLIEAMKKLGMEKCIMLDSDVITFYNYSELDYSAYKAAVAIPKNQDNFRYTALPHCSYWTISGLIEFTNYCINTYKNNMSVLEKKYKNHLDNNIKGGICDMSLLYLWAINDKDVYNNLIPNDKLVIDANINKNENYYENEYEYSKLLKIKKIYKKNNCYYFKKDNNYKKIICLHFQGRAKYLMNDIYNKKNWLKIGIDREISFIKYMIEKLKK